jgi:hypothetical protein
VAAAGDKADAVGRPALELAVEAALPVALLLLAAPDGAAPLAALPVVAVGAVLQAVVAPVADVVARAAAVEQLVAPTFQESR